MLQEDLVWRQILVYSQSPYDSRVTYQVTAAPSAVRVSCKKVNTGISIEYIGFQVYNNVQLRLQFG